MKKKTILSIILSTIIGICGVWGIVLAFTNLSVQGFISSSFGDITTGNITSQDITAQDSLSLIDIPNPTSAVTAALASPATPGNVDNGTYNYEVAFLDQHGFLTGLSPISNTVTVTNKTINGKIRLTNIPVSSDPRIIDRNIYRYNGSGGFRLVDSIGDNSTTTYTDNSAQSSLVGYPVNVNGTSHIYLGDNGQISTQQTIIGTLEVDTADLSSADDIALNVLPGSAGDAIQITAAGTGWSNNFLKFLANTSTINLVGATTTFMVDNFGREIIGRPISAATATLDLQSRLGSEAFIFRANGTSTINGLLTATTTRLSGYLGFTTSTVGLVIPTPNGTCALMNLSNSFVVSFTTTTCP